MENGNGRVNMEMLAKPFFKSVDLEYFRILLPECSAFDIAE